MVIKKRAALGEIAYENMDNFKPIMEKSPKRLGFEGSFMDGRSAVIRHEKPAR